MDLGIRQFTVYCGSKARLDGKTVVITGANTGIGKEIAIDLAKRGAHVIIACRNMEKAYAAVECIKASSNSELIRAEELDLESLESVRHFADTILTNEPRIDILINNAGLLLMSREKSKDGFERHMAANYLGHFLLTILILPRLKESDNGKIINVSSFTHALAKLNLQDLNMDKIRYCGIFAYSNSKLAMALFTRELATRLKSTKIHTYAVDPGWTSTDIFRNLPWWVRQLHKICIWSLTKTPKQGAQTAIYCAVDERADSETGLYYRECSHQQPKAIALDDKMAHELWNLSCQMLSIDDPLPADD